MAENKPNLMSIGYGFGDEPVPSARGGPGHRAPHMLDLIGQLTRLDKRPWQFDARVGAEVTEWIHLKYESIQAVDSMQRRVAMYARDEKLEETKGWTYETTTSDRKPKPDGSYCLYVRKRKAAKKQNGG